MHILPVSFALFTYTGYWRPVHWPVNSLKYWLYNVYSFFMFTLINSFVLYGLMDTFQSVSLQEFVDKFYLFLSVFGVSIKLIHLFIRRRKIIALGDMLLEKNCLPRDAKEVSIKEEFDRNARQVTIACEILNETCCIFATFAQYYVFVTTRMLPVYNWSPFDLSSLGAFLPMLFFQSIALMLCANSSVAHETLIAGMMLQICSQFEILCHRIDILPMLLMEAERNSKSIQDLKKREQLLIRDVIEHHLYVYKFARQVNAVFTLMMFAQFLLSSLVLCMSVYKVSTMASLLTFDFAYILSYLCAMLMQIFLYCWYGNEAMLKSMEVCDAVYKADWTILKSRPMKNLVIIMMRSFRPVKMSSGYLVTLTIGSFMSLLKISYSSYNFLKDS